MMVLKTDDPSAHVFCGGPGRTTSSSSPQRGESGSVQPPTKLPALSSCASSSSLSKPHAHCSEHTHGTIGIGIASLGDGAFAGSCSASFLGQGLESDQGPEWDNLRLILARVGQSKLNSGARKFLSDSSNVQTASWWTFHRAYLSWWARTPQRVDEGTRRHIQSRHERCHLVLRWSLSCCQQHPHRTSCAASAVAGVRQRCAVRRCRALPQPKRDLCGRL